MTKLVNSGRKTKNVKQSLRLLLVSCTWLHKQSAWTARSWNWAGIPSSAGLCLGPPQRGKGDYSAFSGWMSLQTWVAVGTQSCQPWPLYLPCLCRAWPVLKRKQKYVQLCISTSPPLPVSSHAETAPMSRHAETALYCLIRNVNSELLWGDFFNQSYAIWLTVHTLVLDCFLYSPVRG